DQLDRGEYVLRLEYLGYEQLDEPIAMTDDVDVGTLYLSENTRLLNEVTINVRPPVGKQLGDTTQFNAGAFQTMKDASAQDLIEKMPGMSAEDGALQAQGEAVAQILVDGQPF